MRPIPMLFLLLVAPFAIAQNADQDVYVPDSLREWAPWVLQDREYRDCPFLFDRGAAAEGDYVCAWPGTLQLDVDDSGAGFRLAWTVVAGNQWLPLPGDGSWWPRDVRADGSPVSVVDRGGVPSVRLGPGGHLLTGRFAWDTRPSVLPVPDRIGLVGLTLDGERMEAPERSRDGIFLGRHEAASPIRDAIDVRVFRLARDDVPTRLVTRLRMDVAGSVREEVLGPVLPDGFVPLALSSPLPARLEPDGNLRIQVRPGSWQVEITARAPGVSDRLEPPEPPLLPAETWSWQASDRLRVTAVEGVPPVDPAQANVPPEWRQLPAFHVEPGDALEIVERSRGIVAADNELSLSRHIWLDFSGAGFVVSDMVGGSMRSGWRLDMRPPYTLQSAAVGGDYLQITQGSEPGRTGVELRRTDLSLESIGRIATRGSMPVTGWDSRFASTSAILDVPPGHMLFTAPGVDRAGGSWTGRWQLLDFFLVLVVTIGTWRLLGPGPGILALAALTLSLHEPGAPGWLWLNLLVAMALVRVATEGRLGRFARGYEYASAGLVVIVLIPFIVTQLTIAIYPQLENRFGMQPSPARIEAPGTIGPDRGTGMVAESLPAASDAAVSKRLEATALQVAEEPVPADGFARYAADEIVQAGPARPDWQWNRYRLEWSGPVTAAQDMRLVILPRWAVGFLRIFAVALLLAYAAVLAARILPRPPALLGRLARPGGAAGAAALLGAALLLSVPGPDARAQTPDPELLRELEARLLEPPDCVPRCAEIVAADVEIGVDTIRIRLTVHAFADVAVPLPGSAEGWRPSAVQSDASAASGIVSGPGGVLWIRVPEGRHGIDVAGSLAAGAESIEIPFPAVPRVIRAIDADAGGWLVSGIENGRLVAGSLSLTRVRGEAEQAPEVAWESSRFPAFAEITRRLRLDLDWSATTTVRRVAPEEGALSLDIPLLPGESVLTEDVSVSDGRVRVSMAPGQRVFVWQSALPQSASIELGMEAGAPWQEVWDVGIGRTWHVDFSGVPESESGSRDREARVARFYPRGGESLAMDIARPAPAGGSTLAFDSVTLAVDAGQRSRTATLDLAYRSTRGDQHLIRLPADAEIGEVRIDGRIEPLRAEGGELPLPILPGEHRVSIRWQAAAEMGLVTATPAVDIGAGAGNLNLALTLPHDRWLLGTRGPALGPAVLYWPALAALVLFAAILGRIRLTPLGTRQWLLLGLGFSTFNWPVYGWVVAWLLVCGARERMQTDGAWWRFNAIQAAVAFFTVTSLLAIVGSLPEGLLGTPDMVVTGNSSYGNRLNWFADQSAGALPVAAAFTVPLWTYKALILGWALWLSFALLRWLPWVWRCFSRDGYWRDRPARG